MTARVNLVLQDVLRLTAQERCAAAAALVDSLETDEEGSVAETWRTELVSRRAELQSGAVKAASWLEVRQRMIAM